MTNDTENEYLTTKELATILRVSVRTIYRKCKRGEIPGMVQSGPFGHYRYRRETVLHWLNEGGSVV